MNGNDQMTDGIEYIFNINWNTAQSVISAYTYALTGYEMTVLLSYMSFDGFMQAVTSTSMEFHLIPYHSSFFRIKFYFILLVPCNDQIVVE